MHLRGWGGVWTIPICGLGDLFLFDESSVWVAFAGCMCTKLMFCIGNGLIFRLHRNVLWRPFIKETRRNDFFTSSELVSYALRRLISKLSEIIALSHK